MGSQISKSYASRQICLSLCELILQTMYWEEAGEITPVPEIIRSRTSAFQSIRSHSCILKHSFISFVAL
jgi:hypothetical protein